MNFSGYSRIAYEGHTEYITGLFSKWVDPIPYYDIYEGDEFIERVYKLPKEISIVRKPESKNKFGFINWAEAKRINKVSDRKIHFRRFTPDVYVMEKWDKPLSDYLIKQKQFVETSGTTLRSGFVCIDINSMEIWHHTVSSKRTELSQNLNDWINYFKRL